MPATLRFARDHAAARYHRRMLVHPQFNPIALDLSKIGLPIADPLVRPRPTSVALRPVPVPRVRGASRLPQFAAARLDPARRRGPAVLRRARRRDRRPARLRAVLQAGLLRRQSARGLRGLEGRHGVPRRPARRDASRWRCSRVPRKRPFLEVTDLVAPCVPTGLRRRARIGNFINGELWGRFADPSLPWAMVFPQSGSPLPRHPSQLYQFALEGPAAVRRALDLRARSRAGSARCRARSSSATACCASSPSSSASPTTSSACSRSA